ncbi:hypothetical protein TNCV_219131 [Trichonephila clavipes]|nr:hypothetical protein TNCV_219131 [Trichonephila clavipes]
MDPNDVVDAAQTAKDSSTVVRALERTAEANFVCQHCEKGFCVKAELEGHVTQLHEQSPTIEAASEHTLRPPQLVYRTNVLRGLQAPRRVAPCQPSLGPQQTSATDSEVTISNIGSTAADGDWPHSPAGPNVTLEPNNLNDDVQLLGLTIRLTFPVPTSSVTHASLNGELVIKSLETMGTDWACQEYNFVAMSRLGLQNHAMAHKREQLQDKDVPLRPLSKGELGDLLLAPILQGPASQQQDVQSASQQSESDATRIDLQRPTVLDSFRYPLNTILKWMSWRNGRNYSTLLLRTSRRRSRHTLPSPDHPSGHNPPHVRVRSGYSSSACTSYLIISSSSVVNSVDLDLLGLCLAILISISAFVRFLLFFEFCFTFCGVLDVLESSLLGVVVADSNDSSAAKSRS